MLSHKSNENIMIISKKAWLCGKNIFIDNFHHKDKIDSSKFKAEF